MAVGRGGDLESYGVDVESYLAAVEQDVGRDALDGLATALHDEPYSITAVYVSLVTPRVDGCAAVVDGVAVRALVERLNEKRWELPEAPGEREAKLLHRALLDWGLPEDEAAHPAAHEDVWERLVGIARAGAPPDDRGVADVLSRTNLEGALRRHRLLRIEGKPGAGKTTTLRRVAMALIEARLGRDEEPARRMGFCPPYPLPVFVRLGSLSLGGDGQLEKDPASLLALVKLKRDPASLLDVVAEAVEPLGHATGWLRKAAVDGRVALLFDALDEVADAAAREAVARGIGVLARDYGAKVLVTSRPHGLSSAERGHLPAPPFAHCSVEDLSDRQIRTFLHGWYRALRHDAEGAAEQAAALWDRVRSNPRLLELARRPIRLVLLALAAVQREDGALPERPVDVYEDLLTAMNEGKRRPGLQAPVAIDPLLAAIKPHERVELLMRVAWEAQSKCNQGEIQLGPLQAAIGDCLGAGAAAAKSPTGCDALLRALANHTGLLDSPRQRVWSFPHGQIREFLAARWLCLDRDKLALAEELKSKLPDAGWREVTRFCVGWLHVHDSPKALALVGALAPAVGGEDGAGTIRAGATIALALADLREAGASELDAPVKALTTSVMRTLKDPAQHGEVLDRVAIGDAIGYGDDPRLGADLRWVPVPAGEFWRGAAEGDGSADDDEKPGCSVFVSELLIQRWAVTVGEYAPFVDHGYGAAARGLWHPAGWEWKEDSGVVAPESWEAQHRGPRNRAVMGVSWWEADAFCRWVTRHRRTEWGVPAGCSVRLPTEAEWEKAARGGAEDPASARRLYPWDGEWDERNAIHGGLHLRTPAAVGLLPRGHGPYGAWDQSGNVWEWCIDLWTKTAYSTDVAPPNPVVLYDGVSPFSFDGQTYLYSRSQKHRIARGGGYWDSPSFLRVSFRHLVNPESRLDNQSFRCVVSPLGN